MKPALYAALVVGLVPLQTSLLHYLSFGGVRPDLCLVAAGLIGFLAGPVEGALVGIALGFTQDLFSAGTLGLNLIAKGAVGLLAGLAGRQVTNATMTTLLMTMVSLSVLENLVFLFVVRGGGELGDRLAGLPSVLLPETLLNATLGAALYWLLPFPPLMEQEMGRRPIGLVG
nr:rod shape-determining protein MreD [Nitrospirota bacterium]